MSDGRRVGLPLLLPDPFASQGDHKRFSHDFDGMTLSQLRNVAGELGMGPWSPS
jgi:hypothetical protein